MAKKKWPSITEVCRETRKDLEGIVKPRNKAVVKTKHVRIISCKRSTYWYIDSVGGIFSVYSEKQDNGRHYKVVQIQNSNLQGNNRLIEDSDCEDVNTDLLSNPTSVLPSSLGSESKR